MKKILFQGDSITDAWRAREYPLWLGGGFATMIAGALGKKYPGEYEFQNVGICGNRCVDLYGRNRPDVILNKPDYMFLLIGINDIWAKFMNGGEVPLKKYERVMDALLDETFEELPNLKLFLLEPFVTKGSATEEHYDYFEENVRAESVICRRLAEKYGAIFVPLQDEIDRCDSLGCPRDYFITDGIHPSAAGNQVIADILLDCFEKNK